MSSLSSKRTKRDQVTFTCFYQNINGRIFGLNEFLGLSDFKCELKILNYFLLTVALTIYLGSDNDSVIIDLGRLIYPERQTHFSDSKRIKVVIESEIGFWERRPIFKECFIVDRPLAPRVLHEFLNLQSEGRGAHYIVEGLIWLDGLKLLHIASDYHVEGYCVHKIEATDHSF